MDKRPTMTSMAAIGETLKNAREKRSLTIDQVQKQTRIYSTVLMALEEGRCDEILTTTYVKSFLAKYANYLGLDSKEMLKEYSSIHHDEPATEKIMEKKKVEMRGSENLSKVIYVVSFSLLLIAFLSLIVFLARSITPNLKKSLKPKTARAKSVSAVPVKIKAATMPKVPAQSATARVSIPKTAPFKLDLKVRQRVLVEIKKDGVLLFKRSLPKGTVESFTANDKIELYVAKAEAIELVLNGKSLGSPGKGVIRNLEVTNRGIKSK